MTHPDRDTGLRPPQVKVFRDGKLLSEYSLTRTRYVIGRNSAADIRLDDPTVSRPHAELMRGPFGRWWVQDLGSTNSTVIGGKRVARQMLHHRDRVGVGDFVVEFRHAPRDPAIRPLIDSRPSIGDETLRLSRVAPSSSAAVITPGHLGALTALGRAMLETEDGKERLDMLCKTFVETLPGDTAMSLRLSEERTSTVLSGPHHRNPDRAKDPHFSKTLMDTLWRTKEAIVATNLADKHGDISLCESIRPLCIIACPIKRAGEHLDVLWVEMPFEYATKQWRAMVELAADGYAQARMVSQMRHDLRTAARVEHDLELARDVQSRLLPDCSEVAQLDVAVGYEPSHWVGGDYVDALRMADGRVLLIIADVCGKGLSAALVSSSVHTMVHALTDKEHDLGALVSRVNSYLCTHLPTSSFVTLLAIAIDPSTGTLECLNAGHPPALVISSTGKQRWLQTEQNVAVGMLDDAVYEVERTTFASTDTLLMFTDGAFEQLEGEDQTFDPGELANTISGIVSETPRASAELLRRKLSTALEKRTTRQLRADDTTFLIARRLLGSS